MVFYYNIYQCVILYPQTTFQPQTLITFPFIYKHIQLNIYKFQNRNQNPILHNMDHQQLNYLDSKLIFFFNNLHKPRKPSTKRSNRLLLAKQRSSVTHTNVRKGKENSMEGFAMENEGKNMREEGKDNKVKGNLQIHEQELQLKINQNTKIINHQIQQNTIDNNKQIIGIDQNRQQLKQQLISHQYHGKNKKLVHYDILSLFGKYHTLYQIYVDYLVNDVRMHDKQSQTIQQNQQQQQNQTKYFEQPPNKNHSRSPSTPFKISQYSFHNDRAPIVKYLKSKSLTTLYQQRIKQNLGNKRYVDHEFSHEDVSLIDGKQVEWIYIAPSPTLQIFSQSQPKQSQQLQSTIDIPFVKFIKYLYILDPTIFHRLLEPPLNNVFSIWSFCHNRYQPIIIDGYFPNNGRWRVWTAKEYGGLWLAIVVKCICKIYGSYEEEVLRKVSDGDIYALLYGQKLNIVMINQENKESKVIDELLKRENKKHRKILIKKGNQYKIGDEQRNKCFIQLENNTLLYTIPQPRNWYTYCFPILLPHPPSLTLTCCCPTKLFFPFFFPPTLPPPSISIYKIANQQHGNQSNLILCHKIYSSETNVVNVVGGLYRILWNDQGRSVEQVKQISKQREEKQQGCNQTVTLTIMSSIQVKIVSDHQ